MIQGRRRTESGFPTRTLAEAWEAKQTLALWREIDGTSPQGVHLTRTDSVGTLLNAALDACQLKGQSKATYNSKLRIYKLVVEVIDPDTRICDVTRSDALAAMEYANTVISGRGANDVRKECGWAWNWANRYHDLNVPNPFTTCERFAEDRKPKYVPSLEDGKAVIEATTTIGDKAFLTFLLHTGARRGEAFRLCWEHIDLGRKQVTIGSRKTGGRGMEYRTIPLTDDVCDLLKAIRPANATGHVFVSPETGKPYASRQHYMRTVCKRAGVRYFSFHALRHLCASAMVAKGLDLAYVQTILRHGSIATTARYVRTLGAMPNKLNDVFGKN